MSDSKLKGDTAVGQAIGYYTLKGWEVLLPIGDKQSYDLVVDDGERLMKIQSKFAGALAPSGSYRVELRITGGNKSRHTREKYKTGDFDLLFVLTADGSKYVIPYSVVEGKSSITVCDKHYGQYKV